MKILNYEIVPNGKFFRIATPPKDSQPKVKKIEPVNNVFVQPNPVMIQIVTRKDRGRISIIA